MDSGDLYPTAGVRVHFFEARLPVEITDTESSYTHMCCSPRAQDNTEGTQKGKAWCVDRPAEPSV